MEKALRISAPIARKFGMRKLGQFAIDEAVLPTESGAAKAAGLRDVAQVEKSALLSKADESASVLPSTIVQNVERELAPQAKGEFLTGNRRNLAGFRKLNQFQINAGQSMKPSDLELAKKAWDVESDAARKAAKAGAKPMRSDQRVPIIAAREASKSLESVAPGYVGLNKRIMMSEGVRQAAQGRVDIPAKGLDNMAVEYAPTKWRLLMRMAKDPATAARLAIAMNRVGPQGVQAAAAPARQAILSLLSSSHGKE